MSEEKHGEIVKAPAGKLEPTKDEGKYGSATEEKIAEILQACNRYGNRAIIALAGVPGTGKSFIASIAAQRLTNEPLLVREMQFHQSFSYEEFVEGMRIDNQGAVSVIPGIFLDWNQRAHEDPDHLYVLLVEELTRANVSAVLGELMTYLEHRNRFFVTVYSRQPVQVAENLVILATFNPTDRSAIEIDNALLRRLRIIDFPPSPDQLREMLSGADLNEAALKKLEGLFLECKKQFPESYEFLMPFGHGIFADVKQQQPDLHLLWNERIRHLLRRPLVDPHPFTDVIEENYPWRSPDFKM